MGVNSHDTTRAKKFVPVSRYSGGPTAPSIAARAPCDVSTSLVHCVTAPSSSFSSVHLKLPSFQTLPCDLDEGEDEQSLAAHRQSLRHEWAKAHPSPTVVEDLLGRTKKSRRRLMASSTPQQVLDHFPVFQDFQMVLIEL